MTNQLMKDLHEGRHFGTHTVLDILRHFEIGQKNTKYCRASSVKVPSVLCKQPQNLAKATTWKVRKGMKRGKNWQVDFSKLPRQESYQYVLVLVGMFTVWPEAFP